MTTPSEMPTTSYRMLLANRTYRALWLGQLISVLGDRLHQIALLVLVGGLTDGSLAQIGLLLATIGLPDLLFGLFAGALVDRWDRRRVMIVAALTQALLVATLPSLARIDTLWVYVVSFLLATANLFFKPARDSSLPNIVPEHSLTAANALASTTDTALDVLGYPLAGALVVGLTAFVGGDLGISLAFYLDAASFLAAGLLVASVRFPSPALADEPASPRLLLRMVGEGLRFVAGHAALRTNTVLIGLAVLVSFGSWTLTFGYAQLIGAGAFGYAVLETGMGVGAVLGGLAMGRWGERLPQGPAVIAGLLVMGVSAATLAVIDNLWVAAVMLGFSGVGNMLAVIPSVTLSQTATPDGLRGRVLSFRASIFSVAFVVSNLLAGFGAEQLGVQPMWALTNGLLVAVALLACCFPSARFAQPHPSQSIA